MSDPNALVGWLSSRSETELAALLEQRPNVLLGAQPRDLVELAQRLWQPHSLFVAIRGRSLPCLQVLAATQFLGDGCTQAELVDLLAGDGSQHVADVEQVVAELTALAVITMDERARLILPDSLGQIIPDPLGLGTPIRLLFDGLPVDAMRRIQTGLGLGRQKNRADTLASLVDYFRSAENVAALLATAPEGVPGHLASLDPGRAGDESTRFDLSSYRRRLAAFEWAGQRGLVIGSSSAHDWQLPAEVARGLRGAAFRAPFTPLCPQPPAWPVAAEALAAASASAAMSFADHTLAVLDFLARSPIPRLKSGGVGAREITKLSKATGADGTTVRLILELAAASELLDPVGLTVAASDDFASWRESAPGDRFAKLLVTWWEMGSTPTETRDAQGKAKRAIAGDRYCEGCRLARQALIATMIETAGASDRSSFAAAAVWRHPFIHVIAEDEADPFTTIWREAEVLGVISLGSVTDMGRLLAGGDPEMPTLLVALASRILPRSTDEARFGADLTAFVVGAPTARVSTLLDSAADREGGSAASIWRFSPMSVRRAFDEGDTSETLLGALAEIATAGLPQPLEYLIADVARRHGKLRLTSAASCVRCDDEALLATVAVDRKFTKFHLRLLAPTVLAADAPADILLMAMRSAGYFPVLEDQTGAVIDIPAGRRRASVQSRDVSQGLLPQLRPAFPRPVPADPQTVATRLLRRGSAPLVVVSDVETDLRGLAKSLSTDEVRQLAHAIERQSRVGIEYRSASGSITTRVIDQLELSGGSIFAWCELRADDRVFTVARITSVRAV